MARDDFLVFGRPDIGEEEIAEVVATLRSGWLGTGPRTARFETEFAEYVGAPHALGLNSCTAALHVAMLALGVGPGDEVVTTPLTFAATANAIVHSGATPVFADVDPLTGNVDPAAVEAAITPRTRVLLLVHLAGRPCAMGPLMELARRHGLMVVEDCAHTIEARYEGRAMGTFGAAGCFSFYVTKTLTTGEGGMLVSADDEIAARAKVLSLHGMSQDAWRRFSDAGYRHYEVVDAGFKYNMTDLQAALGIHQLARVEERLARREEIWARYDAELASLPVGRPAPPEPGTRHARHLYTVTIDPEAAGADRETMLVRMTERNIGVGVHYVPVHRHPFYAQRFSLRPEQFPHADRIGRETMSLPMSSALTDRDVDDVVEALAGALAAS